MYRQMAGAGAVMGSGTEVARFTVAHLGGDRPLLPGTNPEQTDLDPASPLAFLLQLWNTLAAYLLHASSQEAR